MNGMGITTVGVKKLSEKQDDAYDKKHGIKENAPGEQKLDKKLMSKKAYAADLKEPKIKGKK